MRRLFQGSPFRRLATGMAFVVVLLVHLAWISLFPEIDPAQDSWIKVPVGESVGWLDKYITGGHYWMGYAYALSIGFAVYALLLFMATRMETSGRFAVGSIGLSGFLAVFGCFLIGCCGSPMLGVYLSLFGASFLPFAKPLVAILMTLVIAASWIWLRRKHCSQPDSDCQC